MRAYALLLVLPVAAAAVEDLQAPVPMTIDELRDAELDITLVIEDALDDDEDYSAYLVAYEHAGLTLHAMIAVPRAERPDAGYPVVIANHGYVPDPRKYGIRQDGRNARPGDYYHAVPGLFASRGFLTVLPDYRGHNSSDGFAFIDPQDERSVGYYAEDVAALLSAIDQIESADAGNVFMWSHSMGGPVAMRVLQATDIVRASSFWSTMSVDDLRSGMATLDGPVIVQHSLGDEATPHANSESLAKALDAAGLLHDFVSHPGDEHLFGGETLEAAADRDAALFRSRMQ